MRTCTKTVDNLLIIQGKFRAGIILLFQEDLGFFRILNH
jgi:hypothetical protein